MWFTLLGVVDCFGLLMSTLPFQSPVEDLSAQGLYRLMTAVKNMAGRPFSGVGVIVTASPDDLPIAPLRDAAPDLAGDAVAILARFSKVGGPYHDGFHVLSPEGRIIRVAQYFSPPILRHDAIDRTRSVGARYVAALYGSALPNVSLTGVASRTRGVSIFVGGVDVTAAVAC